MADTRLQTYSIEHVSSRGWIWLALPFLRLPAIPVFLILGLFRLWIGQRGGDGRRGGLADPGVVGGSRRPRRRRGRGLS